MKTLILFATLLLTSLFSFGQVQNNEYGKINVYNSLGQNPHDFIFSYDVVNGAHTCINNFEVVSKVSFPSSFQFQIFVNNILVYTGSVNLSAYGSFFFDNAYTNCNSLTSNIRIVVL